MGDIFVPLLVCFIIFTLIAYCFKRRKEGFASRSPGVTVTTTHVASPIVNPPYPIDQRHTTPAPPPIGFAGGPVTGYPTIGIVSHPPAQGVYPHHHTSHYAAASVTPYIPSNSTAPLYPPSNTGAFPSIGAAPVITTRPSAPACDVQPPSYYEATAHTAVPHEKQRSYNPHF